MKQHLAMALIVAASMTIGGCGSFMAAVNSGPVEEDPGERTLAQRFEDESIETKAMINIRTADDEYDGANLTVVSYNGFVLLVGQVESDALKEQASQVVRRIDGVRRIYNELEAGPVTSVKTRTSDAWLTAQVKSALLFRSDTPGSRTKVVSENGIVYLMGLLTSEEADRVAAVARGVENVKTVVKLFEIIEPISQS